TWPAVESPPSRLSPFNVGSYRTPQSRSEDLQLRPRVVPALAGLRQQLTAGRQGIPYGDVCDEGGAVGAGVLNDVRVADGALGARGGEGAVAGAGEGGAVGQVACPVDADRRRAGGRGEVEGAAVVADQEVDARQEAEEAVEGELAGEDVDG